MVITLQTSIQSDIDKVWDYWTQPQHIVNWNFASDHWCCPTAENDLRPGGKFSWRMEAKDGSMGFDFAGTYDKIDKKKLIAYRLTDGRAVTISFSVNENEVVVSESFETEGSSTDSQQRDGWQAILGNFKTYVESNQH